jgi:hypothetical protein
MAFRRALTDRLNEVAQSGRWGLPQLQRQMAYDRFLARLYIVDDGWIIKGATALIARGIGVRATIDVDIYRAVESHVAIADIARAAKLDLGDWFGFELGAPRPHADDSNGIRIPVDAYIGATMWSQFHIDLVGRNLRVVDQPDDVTAIARVNMATIDQLGYRALPLVDHVADKVMAIIERHGERPSTRFKDLVDLVAIVTEVPIDARAQYAALKAEAAHRGIILPISFHVPDQSLWKTGFENEARRSLLRLAKTLDEALAIIRPFIDALLDGSAFGQWDPSSLQWRAV